MPEAPPHRPGHAGYTPQVVKGFFDRLRLRAIGLSPAATQVPELYAGQVFPRVQSATKQSSIQTALAIAEDARRMDIRQPHPLAFREGLDIARGAGG